MKITIDVDCTPEEARRFFGLPDVRPMQEAFVAEMQSRMEKAMAEFDPTEMMRSWMAPEAWEALRKAWQPGGPQGR